MANEKHDLVEYPIQDNVRLESYWRDDAGGRGPAASLFVYDDEIMRFDCFGGDNGHCHFNLRQTRGRRWMYPDGSFQDHIQQSLFDLRTNLNFCLQTHQDERVQEVQIERSVWKRQLNRRKHICWCLLTNCSATRHEKYRQQVDNGGLRNLC